MAGNGPVTMPRIVLQLSDQEHGLSVKVDEAPYGAGQVASVVLQRIEDVLRMASQPTFHQDVGRGLFRALFPGPLEEVYRAALAEATVQGVPLTLELRFEREAIRAARYPWELLHDGTRFPLQTGALTLTRTVPYPEPPPAHPFTPPGEMLFVAAHPTDQPALVPQYQELAAALEMPCQLGQLDLAYLLPPTWDAFMDWMLAGAPHILHFEGHATLTRTGRLVFASARHTSDPVDVELVAAALRGSSLRLVTLSAAAQHTVTGDSLADAAPWLVLAGVPDVIALQGALPPQEALSFWRAFYQALLDGESVSGALSQGRRALRRTVGWHVPAHFARAAAPLVGARGPLDLRLDTAAPRTAPAGYPLRAALWLLGEGAPPPSAETVRRLTGVAADVDGDEDAAIPSTPCQAQVAGRLNTGAVEVRLLADGCTVHTPVARVTLVGRNGLPPLWFALTPHRAGQTMLQFMLWQGGNLLAEVTHPLEVVRGEDAPSEVVVLSHYWPGALPEQPPMPVTVATPPAESPAVPPSALPQTLEAEPESDVAAPATLDEALDEVLAWLRNIPVSSPESQPPVPPPADNVPVPMRSAAPPATRREARLRMRDVLLLLLLLALIWAAIAALALILSG